VGGRSAESPNDLRISRFAPSRLRILAGSESRKILIPIRRSNVRSVCSVCYQATGSRDRMFPSARGDLQRDRPRTRSTKWAWRANDHPRRLRSENNDKVHCRPDYVEIISDETARRFPLRASQFVSFLSFYFPCFSQINGRDLQATGG